MFVEHPSRVTAAYKYLISMCHKPCSVIVCKLLMRDYRACAVCAEGVCCGSVSGEFSEGDNVLWSVAPADVCLPWGPLCGLLRLIQTAERIRHRLQGKYTAHRKTWSQERLTQSQGHGGKSRGSGRSATGDVLSYGPLFAACNILQLEEKCN